MFLYIKKRQPYKPLEIEVKAVNAATRFCSIGGVIKTLISCHVPFLITL